MATKKVTKKVAQQIEAIAAASIDQVAGKVTEVQNNIRSSLSDVLEALLQKKGELDITMQAIHEKKLEMAEVLDKEKIALSLVELEETYATNKRNLDNQLRLAKEEHKLQMDRMEREEEQKSLDYDHKRDNQKRQEGMAEEDADRQRDLKFEDRAREMERKEKELKVKMDEQGNFEEELERRIKEKEISLKRASGFEVTILKTQHDAAMRIAEADVSRLQAEVTSLNERLTDTEQTVRQVLERNTALATAAMEAQGGKQALEKLEVIAHEQAKSGKK